MSSKQKFVREKEKFVRPKATDKVSKVIIVDKTFLNALNSWINSTNSKKPAYDEKTFYSNLSGKINPKIGVDFEVITPDAYSLLKDEFKLNSGQQKYFIRNPATGEDSVLFDACKITINVQGNSKVKFCSKDWRILDVKNQFCRANNLNADDFQLVEEGGTKNIDNKTLSQIQIKKFVLVSANNDLTTSLKSSKLSTSTNNSAKASVARIIDPIAHNNTNNGRTGSKIPVHHKHSAISKTIPTAQVMSNKRITTPSSGNIKGNAHALAPPSPPPQIIQPNLSKQSHSNTNTISNQLSSNTLSSYGTSPSGIVGGSIGNSVSLENESTTYSLKHSSHYKKDQPLPSLPDEISPPKSPSHSLHRSSSLSKSTGLYDGLYPRPVGLHNLGNTCFFNSAVQCLIRVKPLTDFIMSSKFESQINERNKKGSHGRIARAYRDFINMMSTAKSAQDPSNLRSAIISKYKRFNNYSQHDSQELLGSLLDGLHEDLNQAHAVNGNQPEIKVNENTDSWTIHISKNYSPIVDIFHGEFFSNTECPSCNYVSSVHDPFMFMSVPIPSKLYGKVKLTECLRTFEQVDQLDENNKWECDGCHRKVCATKRMGIYRCAQILIIHLKRFSGSGYFSSKIETEVDYPDILDTSPFVSEGHGAKYQLIGAVFHSGSLGGGHYTSAALDQVSDKWYNFNDSFASPIDISSAHSRSAYIIFYQRI